MQRVADYDQTRHPVFQVVPAIKHPFLVYFKSAVSCKVIRSSLSSIKQPERKIINSLKQTVSSISKHLFDQKLFYCIYIMRIEDKAGVVDLQLQHLSEEGSFDSVNHNKMYFFVLIHLYNPIKFRILPIYHGLHIKALEYYPQELQIFQ